MKFLDNLKLDTWWKAVLYLGVGAVASSFFLNVAFIEAKHLFGLGSGLVFIGIAYWIAEKEHSVIKHANAYTGPAAFLTVKTIKHNPATIILLILGLGLFGLFGFLIVKGLI